MSVRTCSTTLDAIRVCVRADGVHDAVRLRQPHAGAVQRVQRGSVFALPRVPSAPVQPRAFTHLSLRIFMRVS